MEQISPGRINLLMLKNRIGMVRQGLDLLKDKREALLTEFSTVTDRVVAGRESLQKGMGDAGMILMHALGVIGREGLTSASYGAARDIRIDVVSRNVWGVRFPEIRRKNLVRSFQDRGYAFAGESPATDLSAKAFERVLDLVLRLVSEEMKLKRLGGEIRKLGRRIRMLEDRELPEILQQVKHIRQILEEREREEIFRIKRQKRRPV